MTPESEPPDEPTTVHLPAILPSIRSGALTPLPDATLIPSLIADAGDAASWRYIDFFTSNIRNANPAGPMRERAKRYFAWCDARGLSLTMIRPYDVALYI